MDSYLHRRLEIENNPSQMIIEWLNEVSINPSQQNKADNILKVQDFLINKDAHLLNEHLDKILQFCTDGNAEVRITVIGFIEEAGDKQPEMIPLMLQPLLRLVADDSPLVIKRALRAVGRILRATLKWIVSAVLVTQEMKTAWNQLSLLKVQIINMIDSDNDGIRTQAVKFLEGVVLLQTYRDPNSPKESNDFSLEDVPLTLKIARRRMLKEEANHIMNLLIKFHESKHITSINLMVCMRSLAFITKMRPQFMPEVIQTLQHVQNDLPPTLSESQIISVQKHLKLTYLDLLKHPTSIEFTSTITKQLTQLGTKKRDIMKAHSNQRDMRKLRKRQQEVAATAKVAKKAKLETSMPEETEISLPPIIPIPSIQMEQAETKLIKRDIKEEDAEMKDLIKNSTFTMTEIKREQKWKEDQINEKEARAVLEAHEKIILFAVNRIVNGERKAILDGDLLVKSTILTTLAATCNPQIKEAVLRYITDDIRLRLDLALGWLCEEYALLQDLEKKSTFGNKLYETSHQSYNFLLCTLISAINLIQDENRDTLMFRLYLKAPLITEDAIEALKMISCDESRGLVPLNLLKEMVIRKVPKKLTFLSVLLSHTSHENIVIKEMAINLILDLYNQPELSRIIKEYALIYLGFLRVQNPPDILFGLDQGRPKIENQWSESTIRACLSLYFALLEKNQDLIHEIARIYTFMGVDVKRIVLRLIENPSRSLGIASPQLLLLVEKCPNGSETLVARIIHILTEKSLPSAELVAKVRKHYQTGLSDVRFLIPVLNGLTKEEVIAALPKLIKLNPIVMKEVFNRLLISHSSPITPVELLIALHNIDADNAELKTVIKATSLCFTEKQVYTQETLAAVMRHLVEMNPLPILFMRTMIQSLSLYPNLSKFVINILQKLILKQIWKQPKVWEGFVKCCERIQPQSFSVILQLPPQQLASALTISPGLKAPLLAHIETFAENQKAHISSSVMDVLRAK